MLTAGTGAEPAVLDEESNQVVPSLPLPAYVWGMEVVHELGEQR
jgi:hypothetical protein